MPQPGFDTARLERLMEHAGVEVLVASTRHNTRYLTGGYYYPLYAWDAHTRGTQYLSFLVVPAARLDQAFLVGRPGETEALEVAGAWPASCHEAAGIGTRPAAAKTVELLKQHGLDRGRIAVELPSVPADAYRVLADGLPGATFVDAVPILDGLRAVKTDREIGIIREATRRNLDAVEAVLATGRPGETTTEVERRLCREFGKRELHFLYALVCAGPDYLRIPSPGRQWKAGGVLHIDTGGMLEGYIAETCRTGCLGKPSALAVRMLAACGELEAAVLPSLRPQVAAREVQLRGDEFLAAHPLGKQGKFIAHGIGLVHHEDPVVDRTSPMPLEAGMVLSLEMECRNAEVGHVKIEDMATVTQAGGELLGPAGGLWHLSR